MENFKDLLVIILDLKYSKYINKKSYICIYKDCSVSACFNYIYNKKTKSPFGITKSDGKLKIINKKEYNIRINELIRVINNNSNEISKKDINIIQLYYDQ